MFCSVNHFIDSRLEQKKRAGWVSRETMNMWATQLDKESRDRGPVLTVGCHALVEEPVDG